MMRGWIIAGFMMVMGTTHAVDLELTQGINSAIPIAINGFSGESDRQLTGIIDNDLRISGQFRLISAPSQQPNMTQWRQAGADSVLSGQIQRVGLGSYHVRFELFDAAARGRLLLSKEYKVSGAEMRALAHHISDEIYQQLTGERGVFSTRIAYIVVQRGQGKTRYTLDVADMDGNNPQSLLLSSEPIMSPSWSPDGREISYVSFEKKRAQIYSVSVETGKRRLLTDFTGINGAPSWSPDGRKMAVVLSKSGSPKIYTVDLGTGQLTQVTFGDSIDTEPSFSPDGRTLLFTSGRGGSPQIYSLSLSDGKIARMTYDGNYNARASYSRNQKFIVMLHRDNGQFSIGAQEVGSGHVLPITSSSFDESPSIAPNGRLVLYATKVNDRGVLGMVSIDGRTKIQLPAHSGEVQEPAWSPYLR